MVWLMETQLQSTVWDPKTSELGFSWKDKPLMKKWQNSFNQSLVLTTCKGLCCNWVIHLLLKHLNEPQASQINQFSSISTTLH